MWVLYIIHHHSSTHHVSIYSESIPDRLPHDTHCNDFIRIIPLAKDPPVAAREIKLNGSKHRKWFDEMREKEGECINTSAHMVKVVVLWEIPETVITFISTCKSVWPPPVPYTS